MFGLELSGKIFILLKNQLKESGTTGKPAKTSELRENGLPSATTCTTDPLMRIGVSIINMRKILNKKIIHFMSQIGKVYKLFALHIHDIMQRKWITLLKKAFIYNQLTGTTIFCFFKLVLKC